jgi:hypothetical protein
MGGHIKIEQPQSLRTTPFRLSADAYSIYSQLKGFYQHRKEPLGSIKYGI